MKPVVALIIACLLTLAGCQSLPDKEPVNEQGNGNLPVDGNNGDSNKVLLSSQHCLNEYLREEGRVHYGPCLKIITVNGDAPQIRPDGFIALPVATALTLGTSCVYRHADGSPIPATMETTEFTIAPQTFTRPGIRWYLHAHKQARQVVGCKPTLSRSKSPTQATD
ncbi:hypothetical protein GCM10011533_05470 [Streptosporangium jomthongense]|uniref:Lipoprotein n=1 Tax=Marinobacter aromaticivorans TaxID=1494078 RepID=A0ABW2IRB7_9GAMM|nr:hypothetical protein [Marinobacter aromaticivorans]GGE55876.1 hypothetical protein GCM10011533_05470 [Streptosporangium jomthongense]